MKHLTPRYLLRNDFGTYELAEARYVDTAMWGECIQADYRSPGDEAWTADGVFRLDRVRELQLVMQTATATRGEMGAQSDPITASGGATTSEVVANPPTDVASGSIGNAPEVSAS